MAEQAAKVGAAAEGVRNPTQAKIGIPPVADSF